MEQFYLKRLQEAAQIGDKVTVTGNITRYDGQDFTTIEISKGSGKIIEKAQGIEDVVLTEKAQKVMVDGVVYIVRDNKLFNLQGVQVR